MKKPFFIWAILVITSLFIAIASLGKPTSVYAQPGYCANQTVINQWSCLNERINLCNTRWWFECRPQCKARNSGFCIVDTSYRCQVVDYYADCHSTPRCETDKAVNDCAEGATWKSSCTLFNSRPHGCWVFTCGNGVCESQYGEDGSNCPQDCAAPPTPVPTPTPTPIPTPSCTVNLWSINNSIPLGQKISFTASVSNILNGTVEQVNFSSGDTGIVTVSPASDTTLPDYQTQASGVGVGSTTIRAGVIMSGVERCFDTSDVTVTQPAAWWQVVDSDVTTNDDIISRIYSAGTKFILDGPGGYPGVAVYGGMQSYFGQGSVSSKGWLANTTSTWLTKKNL